MCRDRGAAGEVCQVSIRAAGFSDREERGTRKLVRLPNSGFPIRRRMLVGVFYRSPVETGTLPDDRLVRAGSFWMLYCLTFA